MEQIKLALDLPKTDGKRTTHQSLYIYFNLARLNVKCK